MERPGQCIRRVAAPSSVHRRFFVDVFGFLEGRFSVCVREIGVVVGFDRCIVLAAGILSEIEFHRFGQPGESASLMSSSTIAWESSFSHVLESSAFLEAAYRREFGPADVDQRSEAGRLVDAVKILRSPAMAHDVDVEDASEDRMNRMVFRVVALFASSETATT